MPNCVPKPLGSVRASRVHLCWLLVAVASACAGGDATFVETASSNLEQSAAPKPTHDDRAALLKRSADAGGPAGLQMKSAVWGPLSPIPLEEDLFRLAFVGDVSFTWRRDLSGEDLVEGDDPFQHMRSVLVDASFTVANMEGVLVPSNPRFAVSHPNLWAPPEWASTLPTAGIDLMSTANNHVFDGRAEGVFATHRVLAGHGVAVMGSGASREEARRAHIQDVDGGGCVAFLPGTTGVNQPLRDGSAHVAVYRHEQRQDLLDTVTDAAERCPLLVVYYHWGPQFLSKPTSYVRHMAHQMVDAGADLVVGHHPHVLQGVEFYRGAPIAYSLGNFVFTRATAIAGLTGVLIAEVLWRGGNPSIRRLELVPAVIDRREYMPRPASRRQFATIHRRMVKGSKKFKTLVMEDGETIRFEPPRRQPKAAR